MIGSKDRLTFYVLISTNRTNTSILHPILSLHINIINMLITFSLLKTLHHIRKLSNSQECLSVVAIADGGSVHVGINIVLTKVLVSW